MCARLTPGTPGERIAVSAAAYRRPTSHNFGKLLMPLPGRLDSTSTCETCWKRSITSWRKFKQRLSAAALSPQVFVAAYKLPVAALRLYHGRAPLQDVTMSLGVGYSQDLIGLLGVFLVNCASRSSRILKFVFPSNWGSASESIDLLKFMLIDGGSVSALQISII